MHYSENHCYSKGVFQIVPLGCVQKFPVVVVVSHIEYALLPLSYKVSMLTHAVHTHTIL